MPWTLGGLVVFRASSPFCHLLVGGLVGFGDARVAPVNGFRVQSRLVFVRLVDELTVDLLPDA